MVPCCTKIVSFTDKQPICEAVMHNEKIEISYIICFLTEIISHNACKGCVTYQLPFRSLVVRNGGVVVGVGGLLRVHRFMGDVGSYKSSCL